MAQKRNRLEQNKNIVVWCNDNNSIDQKLGARTNSMTSNNSVNPNVQILQRSQTDMIHAASSSKQRNVKVILPPANFRSSKKLKLIPDMETQKSNNETLEPLQQEENLQLPYLEQVNDTVDDNGTDEDFDNTVLIEQLDEFENDTTNSVDNVMERSERFLEVTNSDTNRPNDDEDSENDGNVCERNEVNTSCENCKEKLEIILRKLNEVLQILNASHYNNIINREDVDFATLGNFPLKTVRDVERFERKLKEDASLMELYKKKIAMIGGKNAELRVRNALKMILCDEVAVLYSWTGQKKTVQISQHKIVDGIIETVRQISGSTTTITDLQNTIMEWLRHAGDRVRYQQNKELEAIKKKKKQ